MPNLQTVQYSKTNPLPAILELIPYSDSVLSPKLLDSIRKVTQDTVSASNVTDEYILLVLGCLAESNLITLTSVNPVAHLGSIYFIKRILNGDEKR